MKLEGLFRSILPQYDALRHWEEAALPLVETVRSLDRRHQRELARARRYARTLRVWDWRRASRAASEFARRNKRVDLAAAARYAVELRLQYIQAKLLLARHMAGRPR